LIYPNALFVEVAAETAKKVIGSQLQIMYTFSYNFTPKRNTIFYPNSRYVNYISQLFGRG